MSGVRTTCAYCGVGCGVIATPDGQGGALIEGDKKHPANFGRLCTKGTTLGETIDLSGRLLTPMIGGVRAGWDEATSLVARKFQDAIKEHGPDSVAFYVSGQLLTEDYYIANKLMKGFIGSGNIDTNSRLCMASSVAGHKRAFGTDTVPGTYDDLENADLIVLVGSNLAWCHPVLHQRIMAAKDSRGTKIVNIDPRRTATSDMADLHLGVAPGGDTALFNGLLNAIVQAGAVDRDYVDAHVNGFDDAVAAASAFDWAHVAAQTGIDQQTLEQFSELFLNTKKVVTVYSQGVNQAVDGSDKVNAIINCHLATGRIGKQGMGPFSVTGQPNAMGGREVGGLANMLAVHLDIENAQHRDAVQDFWDAPKIATHAGLKAVDLFEACASGKIKALWVMCTNPAVSLPKAGHVADAIANVDFVAVSEIEAQTDTTLLADVLLPALGWGEKDGTVTNSERRISRQRAFLPAPGEAQPDWKIICDVAAKMGWSDAFDFKNAAQIFDEYAKMTYLSVGMGKDLDLTALSGMAEHRYEAMSPVQWPVQADRQDTRYFADGGFFTADNKARMLPISGQNHVPKQTGFVFNTGRVRDHWHTMTRTARAATLSRHMAEPYLEIHPKDASELGLENASLARVSSSFGDVDLRVLISDRITQGQVFAPIHWTSEFASNGRVDKLVAPVVDPVSGQPATKSSIVQIRAFDMGWYGFAVGVAEPQSKADYWAKAKLDQGWQIELAERREPSDMEAYMRKVLGIHDGDCLSYVDQKSGHTRLAIVKEGQVVGALFGAAEPVALSRSFVTSALRGEDYANLLAGRSGQDQPDAGRILCNCFNVGINTIVDAVETGKVHSLDDIGKTLQAGSNCGSCRPELAALLTQLKPAIAAQ